MKAIIGGKIFLENGWQNGGAIIIDGTKIIRVVKVRRIPRNAEIINAEGKYVMPGLIDAHSHVGVYEEGVGIEYVDINEASSPIMPHVRAIDAISPSDMALFESRKSGITSLYITPGSANPIGGLGVIIKNKEGLPHEIAIKKEAGLKLAFGENPKRVYGQKDKSPTTRMAIAALIREAFYKAQDYYKKRKKEKDLKYEALLLALQGKIPVRAHAHRADDILTAIRIAKEFGLKLVIEHCTEGYMVIKELKETVLGCVTGPAFSVRTKVELKNLSFKTPGILAKNGILTAITADHPYSPQKYLNIYAALAAREGMDEMDALKAVTSNPARILGIYKKTGSISPGKDADIVIFDRHPFDIFSHAEMVMIEGRRYV